MRWLDVRAAALSAKETLRLALPLILAQVATVALAIVDTITFGHLNTEMLAGGGLGAAVFSLVNITCVGVLMATGNIVAFAHGAGRTGEVKVAVSAGLVVAVLLACLAALVIGGGGEFLLLALDQDPGVAATASIYLRFACLGLVPSLVLTVLRGLAVGLGHPGPVSAIMVVAVVVKILVNLPLIVMTAGMDDGERVALGAVWTGASTALTYLVMAIALWLWCRLRMADALPSLAGLRIGARRAGETLRLGLPIGTTYGVEAGLFTAVALIVGRSGEIALAAHTIANQLVYVAFMVVVGLSHAASVRVGQAAGAGNMQEARRRGREALAIGLMTTTATAAVFLLFGTSLARTLVGSSDDSSGNVVALAGSLLIVAAAFQWADGVQTIAMGALHGLKESRSTAIFSLIAYWLIGIPAAFVLASSHGAVGAWWGLCIGLYVAAGLLFFRFEKKTRIQIARAEATSRALSL